MGYQEYSDLITNNYFPVTLSKLSEMSELTFPIPVFMLLGKPSRSAPGNMVIRNNMLTHSLNYLNTRVLDGLLYRVA